MPQAYERGQAPARSRAKQLKKARRRNIGKPIPHGPGGQAVRPVRPEPRQPRAVSRTFRSDSAQGDPTGRKAVTKARRRVRAQAKQTFDRNAIRATRRSQSRAIKAFAELHASDPAKYERRIRENDRSDVEKAVRKVGNTADKALKSSAEFLKRRIDRSESLPGKTMQRETAGFAPPNAGKEIIDLAANLPSGLYLSGAAAKEAAQGRPQRAKKLWKDFKKTSAVVPAVQGDFKEAGKRAAQRPVTTFLEVSGTKALIGRTGGAAARSGALGKAAKRAGSTNRANLKLYDPKREGDGPEVGRTYSKDIINKAAQVALERRTRKGSRVRKHGPNKGTQRRPGRDPNVDRGTYLVPAMPRRMGGAQARAGAPIRSRLIRRVDTRAFSHERARVHRRNQAVKQTTKLLRRKNATGVQLVAEGAARPAKLRHDLQVRKARLAKERQRLTDPARIKQNRAEAKHIRELMKLPDDKLARVVAGAEDFARQQAPVQARGRRVGAWDELGQSKRFYPALQSRVKRQATEEKVVGPRTPEEQAIMAKAVQRRVRRGKPVGPQARKAVEEALGRIPARPMEGRGSWRPVPMRGGIVKAVAEVERGKLGPNPEILARAGVKLPVRFLPLRKEKRGTTGGGYAGIRRDPKTGRDAHLIYYNPNWGPGARNAALWHEVAHAREVEAGRALAPTTKASREAYANSASEARARAFAEKHQDIDLYGPTETRLSSRSGPGGPKGRGQLVTQGELAPYVKGLERRVRVPARKLNEEELASTARILQRRARRGKETLSGLPKGGPTLVTQRPGAGVGRGGSFPAPLEPGRRRKGTAFEEGSRGTGSDALIRQAVLSENQVTAAEGFQLIDREFGIPAGAGGRRYANSYKDAVLEANRRTMDPETGELLPGATPLVPVNIAELRTFGTRLRRKQEEGTPRFTGREHESSLVGLATKETWDAALGESGRGRWVLIPEDVVRRFQEHANVGTQGALHGATNWFKDVVLTSSSPARWIGGNITDIGMRTAFGGITPLDIARGRMIVRRAAKQGLQGEQAASAVSGGGLYHASEALSRSIGHRGTGEHMARTVAAAPWRAWKGGVYALEHAIEELPQWGAVGKAMRQETGRGIQTKLPAAQVKRATPAQFERAVQKTPNAEGYLTPYDQAAYAKMDTYLAPDGKSGFAIRDGELVNLFAQKGAKFSGSQVLRAAERRGAVRLDATSKAGAGLEKFYGKRGWKVDKEEPWDPAYGTPPEKGQRVVFMSRDPAAQRAADLATKHDLKSLAKLHDQQIDNYAARLSTDRALEGRIQKVTEDVIGRWGKVSPNMRRALVIAPFAQWLGASTRYVFVTLPGKHPIKTSILAGIQQMTEEERQALGLSYFIPRDKQVYDYQMGTLPLKVGKNKYGKTVEGVRTARMTSLGTAAGVPGNLKEFLFPQFAGPLDAWSGTSFTNEQLVYPDWWPDEKVRRLPIPPDERVKIGLGALMESTIPFASAFRRSVLDKGRPSEPWSTILTPATRKSYDRETKKFTENPGTTAGGILEWLTPFAPSSRLYTHGAGKAIEEQGITGETLERWRRAPRKAKGKYGFGGGARPAKPKVTATPTPSPYGF